MTTPRPTAGIYARLSLATDTSASISQQVTDGRLRAEQLGADVTVEGIDSSVSARSTKPWDRPGWREIVEARPDIIIIREQSRIARSVSDWGQVVGWCKEQGVRLLTLDQEFDLGTASGQMIANVLASFSQYEAQLIGERIKYSRNELIRNGRRPGGKRPWAMKLAENPNGAGYVLRPDPDRAAIVVEIVERIERGESMPSICRWLKDAGIRGANGGVWQPQTLRAMLNTPAIAGATRQNGKLVLNKDGSVRIDPDQQIIDFDRWLKIRRAKSGGGTAWQARTTLLGGGLLRCSTCGRALGAAKDSSREQYRCREKIECSRRVAISLPVADKEYVEKWLSLYGEAQEELPKVDADPVELARLREGLATIKAALPEAGADQVMPLIEQRDRLEQELIRAQTRSIGRTIRVGPKRVETWLASQGTGRTWGEKLQEALEHSSEAAHAVLLDFGAQAQVLPGVQGRRTSDRLVFPEEE